jgi:hypothetical protein
VDIHFKSPSSVSVFLVLFSRNPQPEVNRISVGKG